MSLPKNRSNLPPAEVELFFDVDPEPLDECLTTYAGIPLFVQGMRAFDVRASIERVVAIKLRERGFDEATYLESF